MADVPEMPEMPAKASAAADVRPEDLEYVVQGTLVHDGVAYPHLARFRSADAALIATLRKVRALVLPNEIESAEDVAAARARLERENADLAAQIEALRAQVEGASQADGGKKSAKAS